MDAIKNFIPFGILVCFVSMLMLLHKCGLPHTKTECKEQEYEEQIKQELSEALTADSLNSATEAKIRAAVDSAVAGLKTRQNSTRIVYRYLKEKAVQSETEYRAGIAPCDTVIALKNSTIAACDEQLLRYDSLLLKGSELVDSYKRELEGKNGTITQLSGTLDKAVKEIERRDGIKQKRFGISAVAGYGLYVGKTNIGLSPTLSLGISYSILRF